MRDRHVVIKNIERAEPAVVDELGAAGTATVHEAIGRRGYLGPELMPIQRDVRVGGSAVTVLSHPGDNLMIHAAVECCRPGDVLVVAVTAPSTPAAAWSAGSPVRTACRPPARGSG